MRSSRSLSAASRGSSVLVSGYAMNVALFVAAAMVVPKSQAFFSAQGGPGLILRGSSQVASASFAPPATSRCVILPVCFCIVVDLIRSMSGKAVLSPLSDFVFSPRTGSRTGLLLAVHRAPAPSDRLLAMSPWPRYDQFFLLLLEPPLRMSCR